MIEDEDIMDMAITAPVDISDVPACITADYAEAYAQLVKRLIESIKRYDGIFDEAMVRKAAKMGAQWHSKQIRRSGEPYIFHPLSVALILAEMQLGSSTIITAILHDTVEDTDATLEDLEREFTAEIAQLVDGVTKLTKIEYQSEDEKQAENFRKFFIALSEDIRVLLVKLADRTHNMRTLHHIQKPEKRYRIAFETMEIYAPLSERIGMHKLKSELQDLAFRETRPEAYESIQSRLTYLREEGASQVDRIVEQLKFILNEHGLEQVIVAGREKMPYSIWQKMHDKDMEFEQLSDIIAFRVITDSVGECYQALGFIHAAYHAIPELFKDYISVPKQNGYQSLHTVVMGPEQQRIEIQIRTHQMHSVAEMGVAAHWSYKQGRPYSVDGKQYRWIREMVTILENASGAQDFLDNTRLEMYHDQVFCFTPKGDLVALPVGATAVDFAFAVHSGVGLTCAGAKVNSRIVPLRTKLKNGDQVSILQSKKKHVSPAWEDFVITGKARSEIRKFLRHQESTQYRELGKTMLEKLFLTENKEFSEKKLKPALKHFNKDNVEALYEAVGSGSLTRERLSPILFPDRKPSKKKSTSLLDKFALRKSFQHSDPDSKIAIRGLISGMAIHYARCCHPLPGDGIVGIVNTGKGVTIHTADCSELTQFVDQPERWIDVAWDDNSYDDGIFIGRLHIVAQHQRGTLGEIANAIARQEGNIHNIRIINRADDFYELVLDVEVTGTSHLDAIIALVRGKKEVHSVSRYKEGK